ncbi:hypothetical protein [Sphingomonas cavernae]|uniref:17 kDa surface antigen n=1 Tax=Sphingomonas cavernae TaxID=2320861 RepID=A0A418W7E9_9SPHN|nr:hypothetical protein [Sphingomonas cavernae]RJF85939.1 hypothetical protein D3876_19015 [Sphingomonas cavernae]
MNKIAHYASSLILLALVAEPAVAAKLSQKDEARVARAAPGDRDDVRYCLLKRKEGGKTGAIAGTAAGAGTGLIAGGNLGETALAAGAGALAGHVIGKGASTNKTCDEVLARNK